MLDTLQEWDMLDTLQKWFRLPMTLNAVNKDHILLFYNHILVLDEGAKEDAAKTLKEKEKFNSDLIHIAQFLQNSNSHTELFSNLEVYIAYQQNNQD
jgi:hypothetical protein